MNVSGIKIVLKYSFVVKNTKLAKATCDKTSRIHKIAIDEL
jgi:hypothetical protein